MNYVPLAKNSSGQSDGILKNPLLLPDKVLIAQLKRNSYRGERFKGSFCGGLGLKQM